MTRIRPERPGRISLVRAVAVTAGLSVIGMLCGAVLGAFALLPVTLLSTNVSDPNAWRIGVAIGAWGGALFGSVLAPLVAWIFLRRVSLGRAIAQTALGVVVGVAIAAVVNPALSIPFGLAGFVAVAVWLWVGGQVH